MPSSDDRSSDEPVDALSRDWMQMIMPEMGDTRSMPDTRKDNRIVSASDRTTTREIKCLHDQLGQKTTARLWHSLRSLEARNEPDTKGIIVLKDMLDQRTDR